MIALAAALLSAAAFYLSVGLGNLWPLAWIAPVPVLWLAFGAHSRRRVFAAAFAAYALGGANLLPAYAGTLPPVILALAIAGPALLFALAVLGAQIARGALGPWAGVLAFAGLWTGFDFLLAFDPASGSVLTPAASQVGAPALIQTAAFVGFSGVTFLLGFVSAAIAAALRERKLAFGLAAVLVFAGNAGFGAWRLAAPSTESLRVALIASDTAVGQIWKSDDVSARQVFSAYAREVMRLEHERVDLVVLPENIARLDPAWREDVLAPLARAASATGATIIAGLNTSLDGTPRNAAWVLEPDGSASAYSKRRLVPGLETPLYVPGEGPHSVSKKTMVVICKDLDFAGMIRTDVAAITPALVAAPAWDFGDDGWSHARIAILRGVENGVPVARSARDGLLTLTDRFGRIVARGRSGEGFVTVLGDVPVAAAPQATPYRTLGGAFGWLSVAASSLLMLAGIFVGRMRREPVPGSSE